MNNKKDITIKDFLKTFGITTTNFDLISMANFLNLEIKVLMKNELEDLLTSYNFIKMIKNNYIINYQYENKKGTHWVAYKDKYYFDSFGLKPLEKLEPFVKKYNQEQLQHYETNICGQLCLYFLYSLDVSNSQDKDKLFEIIISELKELFHELKESII